MYGASKRQINAALRKLQRKHPDWLFEVIRASNGEVAILRKGYDCYGNKLK